MFRFNPNKVPTRKQDSEEVDDQAKATRATLDPVPWTCTPDPASGACTLGPAHSPLLISASIQEMMTEMDWGDLFECLKVASSSSLLTLSPKAA